MEEKCNNMTDNYILDKCFETTGRIKSFIYKQISSNPEYLNIKQYLEHRYSDIPIELFTYKEVLFRIKHNIEIRPKCQICGKPVQFIGKNPGGKFPTYYKATCGKEHERKLAKQHEIKTLEEIYGVSNTFNIPGIKEKSIAARQTNTAKEKRKQTMINKYGYPYAFMSDTARKNANESLKRYRIQNSNVQKTNKQRAYEYSVILKLLSTTNYDLEYYRNHELYKNYVESYNTVIEANRKNFNTRKSNQTVNTSSPENNLNDILCEVFSDTVRNYSDERYNFKCDFYIPTLDLFIEYQGSMFHNKKPYKDEYKNELNKIIERNEELKKLTGKSVTAYDNLIKTWTVRDILKRNTAKQNKLNYLEIYPFYSIEDVPDFIKEQYKEDTVNKQIIIGVSE